MTVNKMNTVVGAKRAAGYTVSQIAADVLGFSQPTENINIHSAILTLMVMGGMADWLETILRKLNFQYRLVKPKTSISECTKSATTNCTYVNVKSQTTS